MKVKRSSWPVLATGLLTVLATMPTPAPAQTPSLMNPGPVVGTPRRAPPPTPPPPGLPGAVTNRAPAPPAATESGLSPTAALFDAINRGDLGAARDAIGRGAQLDAKNVLGMTPLELAVDLNRNSIAFLLLSIEHEGRAAASSASAALALSVPPAPAASRASTAQSATAQSATAESDPSVAALLAASAPPPPTRATRAPRPAPQAPSRPAAVPPALAGPLAGGTGSPNPAVGFLGFGPGGG